MILKQDLVDICTLSCGRALQLAASSWSSGGPHWELVTAPVSPAILLPTKCKQGQGKRGAEGPDTQPGLSAGVGGGQYFPQSLKSSRFDIECYELSVYFYGYLGIEYILLSLPNSAFQFYGFLLMLK